MLGSKTWRVAVATAALAAVLTACETGKVVPVAGGDATFTHVGAVVAIPGGGQYVVDTGACVIRKVDLGGGVTTVAGTGTCGYSGDGGPATAAQINPFESTFQAASGHLALDASGNLYLADSNNGRIRKIDTAGTITTIAGDGTGVGILDFETDTCAGATAFAGGITVTPDNTVYVACPFGIGKVLPDGTLQQVLAANPSALTSDAAGNLYFNSFYEGLVKKLDPATNAVTTISDLNPTLGADRFGHSPIATDLALAPDGTLFVAFGPTTYLRGLGCWGCLDTAPAERSIVVRIAAGVPARVAGTGPPTRTPACKRATAGTSRSARLASPSTVTATSSSPRPARFTRSRTRPGPTLAAVAPARRPCSTPAPTSAGSTSPDSTCIAAT